MLDLQWEGDCRLALDLPHRTCRIGDRMLTEGEFLSLDANDGHIYVSVEEHLFALGGSREIEVKPTLGCLQCSFWHACVARRGLNPV